MNVIVQVRLQWRRVTWHTDPWSMTTGPALTRLRHTDPALERFVAAHADDFTKRRSPAPAPRGVVADSGFGRGRLRHPRWTHRKRPRTVRCPASPLRSRCAAGRSVAEPDRTGPGRAVAMVGSIR